ncbi:uncharacterized protein LOC135225154 [Macrobrachium nipponense]|uniref:uncharacterized protein LOC135225154 n=1 Tax=Macrobrachium nipponense TaxID=159736 RepID=UPI0030C7EED1
MSAYHPLYLQKESGPPNTNSDSSDVDSDRDRATSPRSKRQPRAKHHHPKSRSSGKAAAAAAAPTYHVEDENRSSSEETYGAKRNADKYRRRESYHDQGSCRCDTEDDSSGQELYCQKASSSVSWEDVTTFSYLAGTMQPPSSGDGAGDPCLPAGTSYGSPWFRSFLMTTCRPKFWKFLLIVLILLLMGQFSLNILFYRNYDPLFYVNVSSQDSLSAFESRVRWVNNKLPWNHGTNEKPPAAAAAAAAVVTVIPLHNTTYESLVSVPLLVGGKEVREQQQQQPSHPETKEPMTRLRQIIEASDGRSRTPPQQLHNATTAADNRGIPEGGGGEGGTGRNATTSSSSSSKREPTKAQTALHVSRSNMSSDSASSSSSPSNSNSKQSGQSPRKSTISSNKVTSQNSNGTAGSAQETSRVLLSKEKALCPPVPPNLVGVVKINRTVPSLEEQERTHPELEPGGRFRPAECRARHRVAIIVPYRDRVKHLAMFIYHIHPILQRQQIDYAIYIVEQAGSGKFNRAMLMNVGALESLKQYPYDCFIFHDVDLLPEDDRNLYTCPEQPRHMSIAIDTMHYKLPYNDLFGGVSAMTADQFKTVNGFSNKFWGWGGEDDDMSNRIKFHGFFISRYPANIGRYTMLSHRKDEPNPRRYQYLYDGKKRFKSDGLNSAKYKALDVQLRRLYTWVYVDLYPS